MLIEINTGDRFIAFSQGILLFVTVYIIAPQIPSKMGSNIKGRTCSEEEQCFPFREDHFTKVAINFERTASA